MTCGTVGKCANISCTILQLKYSDFKLWLNICANILLKLIRFKITKFFEFKLYMGSQMRVLKQKK